MTGMNQTLLKQYNMKPTERLFPVAALIGLLLLGLSASTAAQPGKDERMKWFADAKLGIFIHWGIYAVNGIDESWAFYNELISYDDYMKQLAGFTSSA